MRKSLLSALACHLFMISATQAQYYFFDDKHYENAVVLELGISGGMMNSLTDLGGKKGIGKNFIKDLTWKFARPSYGLYIMGMYRNAIGLRLETSFGEVTGYDSILKEVKESTFGRYDRNLSFRSRISEIQLAAEVHPLFFKNYNDTEPPRISPYAVGGIGYFSFDPQAKMNGQWYALQPLRTEGQGFAEYPDRKPYKLGQINFALGLGLRYEISNSFNAKIELTHRILKTDYLDDVSTTYIDPSLYYDYLSLNRAAIAEQISFRSDELNSTDMYPVDQQRGDPEDNDSYFTIHFKLGFTLGRQRR